MMCGDECRWFEFNDTRVTPFDPSNLPNETFGGTETIKASPAALSWGNQPSAQAKTQEVEKYRNAYMVFYDRIKKEDLTEERRARELREKGASAAPATPTASAESKSAPAAASASTAGAVVAAPKAHTRVPVSPKIFQQIWSHPPPSLSPLPDITT
jgi:hypothetical protein